jgi:hypothetical protein
MVIPRSRYPKKLVPCELSDLKSAYIYFVRYEANTYYIYKIGFSRDPKTRIPMTCDGPFGCPALIAYGFTDSPRDVEYKLHSAFWDCNFEFLYEMLIPKWSVEYFKFDYDTVLQVVDLMRKLCDFVVVSKQYDERPVIRRKVPVIVPGVDYGGI